jgi:hypothetical protein
VHDVPRMFERRGEGEVTYIRPDGTTVTVPFANIFELRGTLIAVYRIFIDNSPLFR